MMIRGGALDLPACSHAEGDIAGRRRRDRGRIALLGGAPSRDRVWVIGMTQGVAGYWMALQLAMQMPSTEARSWVDEARHRVSEAVDTGDFGRLERLGVDLALLAREIQGEKDAEGDPRPHARELRAIRRFCRLVDRPGPDGRSEVSGVDMARVAAAYEAVRRALGVADPHASAPPSPGGACGAR